MRKLLLAISLFGVTGFVYAEPTSDLELLQKWLTTLPGLVEERGEIGSLYMQNYIQCMEDQQALNQQSDPTLGQFIDNALESTHACSSLLNEMLEELTDQPIGSLSNEEKKQLLEESM